MAATMGLASCSEVEANLPKEKGESPILNLTDIKNNDLQKIYDALVSAGTSNSERVLNNVLTKIACSKFGSFYSEGENVGLKEAAADDAKMTSFLSAHSFYENDKEKVKDVAAHIEETIAKHFWDVVKNSSYQERNKFYEEKFVQAERADLYEIELSSFHEPTLLDGNKSYRDVQEYFSADYLNVYREYIEDHVLENAMRKLLIEQYLLTDSYGVLGRSYAREVQYIALPDISDAGSSTKRLARSYAKLVLSKTDAELTSAGVDPEKVRDLNFLDRLYKGYIVDATEKAFADTIYAEAGFTTYAAGVDTIATYEETTYGELAKNYNTLATDRWTQGSGKESEFTNSGAYPKAVGLEIKTNELIGTTKVTEGWYTSTGLADLASSIKTRLFKITVANEVDDLDVGAKGSFVWNVQGDYYMVPESYLPSNEYPYVIYDESSKTTTIVRVKEAVKQSKLKKLPEDATAEEIANSDSYDAREGGASLHQIALQVASLLSDSDTYKKAANQKAVEDAALAYHDQAVYDYFVSTFPDLFD